MSRSPQPKSPVRSATTSATAPSMSPAPSAAIRNRLLQRSKTRPDASPSPVLQGLGRRRSSMLSFSSIDDVTQSLRDDLVNPSMSKSRTGREDSEVTHWHSSPLAFALLPAVAGLLFKNGSAFVTDALLLGLAAIFMNWSIRLPWDWYYSAQAVNRDPGESAVEDTIIEEEDEEGGGGEHSEEGALEMSSSDVQATTDGAQDVEGPNTSDRRLQQQRSEASAELRRQELLALASTFVFPALAAYMLHVIRSQLSQASTTSLVSDYNLSVFLLAAEIRPVRQMVRLMADRTLHLQRTVTSLDDPLAAAARDKTAVADLTTRLAELEERIAEHALIPAATGATLAQKADVHDLSAEVRKRYEPRLEGLERAVRRYEKRSATLAMLTEQRLMTLENRTNDALSLAAAAAQNSQSRGVTATVVDTTVRLVKLPVNLTLAIFAWPTHVIEELYVKFKVLMLGPGSTKQAAAKRGVPYRDDKARMRPPFRKAVR